MKDTIVTAISDIVIGLITESVSDGKMTIKRKHKVLVNLRRNKEVVKRIYQENDWNNFKLLGSLKIFEVL